MVKKKVRPRRLSLDDVLAEEKRKPIRMSFVFPKIFYSMLNNCSLRYQRDMTYIVMEAVNDWVMQKENIVFDDDGELVNNCHDRIDSKCTK